MDTPQKKGTEKDKSMIDVQFMMDEQQTFIGPIDYVVRTAGALVYLQRALALLERPDAWPKPIRERNAFKPRLSENRPNLAAILEVAQDGKFDPYNPEPWSTDPLATRYVSEGWVEAKNIVLQLTGTKDMAGLKKWCSPWWRSRNALRKVLRQAMAAANGYR